MPHDKHGRLVEVGDFVKIKPYNTPKTVVGRVVYVNPGAESCNARVAWPEVDVDGLARLFHEAQREAVAKRQVVRDDVPVHPFVEWDDLTDVAREGRRVAARHILAQVNGPIPRTVREDYTECRAMELVLKSDGSEPEPPAAEAAKESK
jgi:hypothetical protein